LAKKVVVNFIAEEDLSDALKNSRILVGRNAYYKYL